MKTIKRIDILSIAKILGMVTGGIYLVAGIVVNLTVLVFKIPLDNRFDILGFGSGILATFMVALLVGAIIFIIGAIMGWIYNLTAKLIGGLHIQLEDLPQTHHQLFQPAKTKEKTDETSASLISNPKPQEEINSIINNKERDSFTV